MVLNYCAVTGSVVKNPPANVGDLGSILGSRSSLGEGNDNSLQYVAWEIPWTGGFGNPTDQRSLAGYSPWGHKESNMAQPLSNNEHSYGDTARSILVQGTSLVAQW